MNRARENLARAALVTGATLAAYLPALNGGFIWDDDFHVTGGSLRSLRGLWRIWTSVGATPQYYPLLHSAFWLEHRLWGDSVLGYHLLNVALHATAACLFGVLLGLLLERPPGAPARFVDGPLVGALLFALHPVCVESVAWISEQKNTLSAVFYLLAAIAYLKWASGSRRTPGAYLLATLLFAAALLGKSVTATLPAALLVIAWWKKGGLSPRRDVAPLVPWLGLGAAAGVFTAWVERTSIGATGAAFGLDAVQRCLLAGRVACFYAEKLLWPSGLTFIYPRWTVDASAAWQYLFPIGAIGALAAAARVFRRERGVIAGLLIFVGTLLPVLGFLNVYPFRYSFVADHFQYLACMGLIGIAAGAWEARDLPRAAPLALACVLGVLTWRQCGMYRDAETLYSATISRNPGCWMAYNNRGNLRLGQGRNDAAIADYEAALALKSDDPIPHNNLGLALAASHRLPESIAAYRDALRLKADYPEAHVNLAVALRRSGDIPGSIAECEEALRLLPAYPEARADLARALAAGGRLPEAIAAFQSALGLDPGNPEFHADIATALSRSGRLPEAIAQYEEALRLNPGYAEACNNLGVALAQAGRLSEAADRLRQAVRLKPDYADARDNLELVLRSLGGTGPDR